MEFEEYEGLDWYLFLPHNFGSRNNLCPTKQLLIMIASVNTRTSGISSIAVSTLRLYTPTSGDTNGYCS
jgi:hypothetical protein